MSQEKMMYELIGGEPVVRKICQRFYEVMDTMPEVKSLRDMHPENLRGSEEKLFMFLSGWLGGPNLFQERFGHPRLRMRHFPFKIGKSERDQWMLCMVQAFEDVGVQEPMRSDLLHSLLNLSDHMRNQPEE
ncbi:group II truncated hemoglobin [Bdellovibrio sp. SKB1291214]|uniref:group II truncated hemoglobin n=1 Tax=Bdellovibrio sp. SKB1291214 TaxID=1732569 RepID=UPI000B516DB8|nr:group II truncated hemoglobin [Bdellovibrio sp. SKB1291214]UYL09528.1 group II truncated hemoglobin [Bdellovibrio sp. SKB1291214]